MLYDVEERKIIDNTPEDMVNPLTGKRYIMAYDEGFFDGLRNAYSKVKSIFSKTPNKKNILMCQTLMIFLVLIQIKQH